MGVTVLLRRGQPGRRHPARLSLLGDGLLERVRSTSLALLGLSTAIGLGLVAVALQQGWPVSPNLPIPNLPAKNGNVGDGEIVSIATSPEGRPSGSQGSSSSGSAGPGAGGGAGGGSSAEIGLVGADRVDAAGPPRQGSSGDVKGGDGAPDAQPTPAPIPSPSQSPTTTDSAPAPGGATSLPVTSAVGDQGDRGEKGKEDGKVGSKGRLLSSPTKAKNDAKQSLPTAKAKSDSKRSAPPSKAKGGRGDPEYEDSSPPSTAKADTDAPVPSTPKEAEDDEPISPGSKDKDDKKDS
jgi:hypothetical protein